jgi:hypothetical protein
MRVLQQDGGVGSDWLNQKMCRWMQSDTEEGVEYDSLFKPEACRSAIALNGLTQGAEIS